MAEILDPPGFAVVPVTRSAYEHYGGLEEVNAESARIVALLAGLGGAEHPWHATPAQRDLTGVNTFLADWAEAQAPRNSVLLWLGHGEAKGNRAWLACHDTRKPMSGTGINPETLAEHVINEWRRRNQDESAWTLVVIEACGADTFARLLGAALLATPTAPQRLAVIGVGDEGTTYLGGFSRALDATIGSYTDNDAELRLKDLVGRLEDRIAPGRVVPFGLHRAAPLRRTRVFPAGVTAPVDVYRELREFLLTLTPDERGHFVPKAQGAEQGELAWYFVGRAAERRQIAVWLNETGQGMLIVTGRAGSGKSALLGNTLVHTNPLLRSLLQRAGHLDRVGDEEQPPTHAFDSVVHLTGLTTTGLVRRIASAAGLELPADAAGSEVDWLLDQLAPREFTLLVDALDEAREPTTIASGLLRRIAALPRGRVVVGTRASVTEGPDQPDPTAEDLLDALGRSGTTRTVVVGRDPDAIATYTRRRLSAAQAAGTIDATDQVLASIADLVAAGDRQFLYARLAVHEILARPALLDPSRPDELADLLRGDHRTLFAAAVERLTAASAVNDPLLMALATARGRGLPRTDRIWTIAATALAGTTLVTEADIDALLNAAAPYIMLDAEDDQTVYRLAHRTFQEFFEARAATTDVKQPRQPVTAAWPRH